MSGGWGRVKWGNALKHSWKKGLYKKGITQICRLNRVYIPGERVGAAEAKSVGGLWRGYKSPKVAGGGVGEAGWGREGAGKPVYVRQPGRSKEKRDPL